MLKLKPAIIPDREDRVGMDKSRLICRGGDVI